jgi:hypothetical protein
VAPRDDDFRFLVQSVQRSTAQQRARHRELAELPTRARGKGLVRHLDETLVAIEAHLGVSKSRFAAATTDVERDVVLNTLRLLNGLLGQMQQANTWVQAAGRQVLGVGALRLVDEATAAMVGRDADVVSVPSDEYRYATMWAPFSRIIRHLGAGAPTGHPIVLFFPSQEKDSLLLEPLLIHELGHSVVARKALVDRVVAHRVGRRSFDRPFSQAATALRQATSASGSTARIVVERHLRRWLTEYLCDAIAVAYTGPAYAYAFAAVVAAESSTELQESHPPTSVRIRLILEYLNSEGWRGLMQQRAPNVLAWLDHLAESRPTPPEPHQQFLLDVTSQFVQPMRDEVAASLGDASYTAVEFLSEQDELADFLDRRILPSQLLDGRPAGRRNVVLAGWLHVLGAGNVEGREGDQAASLPKGLANWEFGSFLDKAVEMSSFLEEWRRK